jgi:hypothetical protein
MSGIARGVRISLEDLPDDIDAFINIRPHKDKPIPLVKNSELQDELDDVLLLPGQVIEFIFAVRSTPESSGEPVVHSNAYDRAT